MTIHLKLTDEEGALLLAVAQTWAQQINDIPIGKSPLERMIMGDSFLHLQDLLETISTKIVKAKQND